MTTRTAKREEVMTDFQAKMLIEMIKDIVRELRDPEKIIERLDQIKRGESGESQKD
jgi:PHD/YefM family antitoxin component YafN of YafNO toxin-antitoxin module